MSSLSFCLSLSLLFISDYFLILRIYRSSPVLEKEFDIDCHFSLSFSVAFFCLFWLGILLLLLSNIRQIVLCRVSSLSSFLCLLLCLCWLGMLLLSLLLLLSLSNTRQKVSYRVSSLSFSFSLLFCLTWDLFYFILLQNSNDSFRVVSSLSLLFFGLNTFFFKIR